MMSTKTFTFIYDGEKRHVVDAIFEPEHGTIIGLEETKGKEKTNQIKRFKIEKIESFK